MSEEFDKEAEREKLREKFADDDQKREHTQRMSELLLKGATMTNRHCDDCGDPIFRQDGQAFCPSCHTVDAADVESDSGATADGTVADTATPDRVSRGEQTPDVGRQPQPRVDAAGQSPQSGADDARSGVDPVADDAIGAAQRDHRSSSPQSREAQTEADRPRSPTEATSAAPTGPSGGETVADARESLARTLTRFARAAEATDDPRRAREQLRAAREAAETLAALE